VKKKELKLDKKIALNMPFVMLRLNSQEIPQYLPEKDLHIERFRKGQEVKWAELEYSVGEFDSREHALKHFNNEFGNKLGLFSQRCFFLYEKNKIIGTVTAWEDSDFFATLTGRLHWLSISPDHQNRGLAKLLISAALNELTKKHKITYLTTLSINFPAIKIYLDFGFYPFIPNENYNRLLNLISELHFHPNIQEIAGRSFDFTRKIFNENYEMKDILKLVL
jgi:ribosomal protein S18 acetylase RimI-like enzyme